MKKADWINERQAAERLGYQPETLRRYCKSGKLAISFTHVRNRNFQYDQRDIEKLLYENATIIYS
jgi:predicted site-specific integrase-resolvase